MRLKQGDRVSCKIKAGNIVKSDDDYDTISTFEIVATDNEGYYLYVPDHIYLQGGITADTVWCQRLNIEPRFIGDKIIYIEEKQVFRVAYQIDGKRCNRCQDFFTMAEANQPNDGFLCYSCRFNPYR